MAITDYPAVAVYTKAAWADEWTARPTIEALTADYAVAPEIPSATLRHHYGNVRRAGAAFGVEAPISLADQYVKITAGSLTPWVGFITQQRTEIMATDAADPTGIRTYTAVGLEHILDRIYVRRALNSAGLMGYVPTFNLRHRRGGTLLGNRHATLNKFGGEEPWTFKNILDYLIAVHLSGTITWACDGTGSLDDDLDGFTDVLDLEGQTVYEALNKLVDRRRGYGWCLRTTGDTVEGVGATIYIHIFSTFQTDIVLYELPLAVPPVVLETFHANTEQMSYDASAEPTIRSAATLGDRSSMAEYVEARGARIRACFTLAYADETLEQDWSGAEGAAYKAACAGITGYAALSNAEKEQINDKFRAENEFQRAFSVYRVDPDWAWAPGDGVGGTKHWIYRYPKGDGTFMTAEEAAAAGYAAGTRDRVFLDRLPLEDGKDYTVYHTPGGYTSILTGDDEPNFVKPLVFCKDGAKWVRPDKLGDSHIPNAKVEMENRHLAARVEMAPRHLLAFNWWESGTPAEPSEWQPQMDWQDLILTVACETDERLFIVKQTVETPTLARRMVIAVPDAHYWHVAAGTVIGIASNETLQRIAGTDAQRVLRDDTNMLRVVAEVAAKWYGVERIGVKLVWSVLRDNPDVGAMLTTLTGGTGQVFDSYSVISRIRLDFVEGTTTLQSNWWGLDYSRYALLNAPGQPSLRGFSKQMAQLRARFAQDLEVHQ